MQFHITICCLLSSFHFVFFANGEKLSLDTEENVANNVTVYDEINDEDRWKLEEADFEKGLKMTNNKGKLIELTTDATPPRGSASRSIGESVSFFLYTRKNPKEPQEILLDYRSTDKLRMTNFNHHVPTIFITHGWVSDGNSSACTLIRDAYLKNRRVNVIVVDWASISFTSYQWAARQVKRVGKHVAAMIDYLEDNNFLDTEETTLVGHSLGAHVMGIAAFNTKGIIKNVFGLDPALPMFRHAPIGSRISFNDAKQVQIIHTNGGKLGYYEPIGRSDFYPNGGKSQLGCGSDLLFVCSHSRAVQLFAESLNTVEGFHAKPCTSAADYMHGTCHGPSIVKMGGFKVDPNLRGVFYLRTNEASPYAIGMTD